MDEQRRREEEVRVRGPVFGAQLRRSFPGRSLLLLRQRCRDADGLRGLRHAQSSELLLVVAVAPWLKGRGLLRSGLPGSRVDHVAV